MRNHSETFRSLLRNLAIALFFLAPLTLAAQQAADSTAKAKKKNWSEILSLRGYTQLRFQGLYHSNDDLKCDQCDRNWNGKSNFSFRRARLIIQGNAHERVMIYTQIDLANVIGTSQQYLQMRDLYVDVFLDKSKNFRIRLGLSKVPYGFENMQSSQNRLPLDRADATNSAVPNERDLGAFLYWAPAHQRELFRTLIAEGYKGSGDYGIAGIGIYNGQITNKAEANDNKHFVARLCWPFEIGSQIIEPGLQAYAGKYTLASDQLSAEVKSSGEAYDDQRMAASLVVYPRPIGVQAEWNVGRGPRYNPATDSIETARLSGGYATVSARIPIKKQLLYPFVRVQHFDGGKKQELDARSYVVTEEEFGVEWLPVPAFELTASFVLSNRRFEDHAKPVNQQSGSSLRIQLQWNY